MSIPPKMWSRPPFSCYAIELVWSGNVIQRRLCIMEMVGLAQIVCADTTTSGGKRYTGQRG
ncbi:hypothetical protein P3T22_005009 [Paraburkholderia sp. GAS348]